MQICRIIMHLTKMVKTSNGARENSPRPAILSVFSASVNHTALSKNLEWAK